MACHNGLSTRAGEDISIGIAWRPTMMANSARDPYWQAGVRRETIDHPQAEDAIEAECSICHMPMAAHQAGEEKRHGKVFSHLRFLPDDPADQLAADGVSCSLCHQIGREKLGTRESFVGGFVISAPNAHGERTEFGPYEADAGHTRIMRSSTGGFVPAVSTHIRESEICATCHTLITQSLGPDGKAIGDFPEQVPYLEWLHSAYRKVRSCQSCHMPLIREDVAITSILGVPRSQAARHTFVGGNFFIKGILNRYRNELSVTALPEELNASADRTREHLQSQSARIVLAKPELRDGRLQMDISVENLVGHKLPTAYPSRRVWLHVRVQDSTQRTVFESGALNPDGSIAGNDNDLDPRRFEPHYREIRRPEEVQIYEAILADGKGTVTTGLLQAVRYLKDNRIPPRGFDKKTAAPEIAVHGAAFEDDDFMGGGDRIRYSIDVGAAQGPFRITVDLYYQPIAHRWAMNLGSYDAEEPRRFVRFYTDAASASAALLASASAEAR